MNYQNLIQEKIRNRETLVEIVNTWKRQGLTVVFTNGCFDIVHPGHVDYLAAAASLGDKLVIGLNSDESITRLKGLTRPIIGGEGRSRMLAAFSFVDAVCFFDEDTPQNLINAILPDVLVKGKDYSVENIVGAKEVIANGGKVETIDLTKGFSTSILIEKIKTMIR